MLAHVMLDGLVESAMYLIAPRVVGLATVKMVKYVNATKATTLRIWRKASAMSLIAKPSTLNALSAISLAA